jgi:hypothetical protein
MKRTTSTSHIPHPRWLIAAGAVLATTALVLPGGSGAASAALKSTTYKGKTSQGKKITVKIFQTGAKTGEISISTRVRGKCPVGSGVTTTMSTNVTDNATGSWPIPSHWSWDHKTSTYEIKVSGDTAKKLTGTLRASWQTQFSNVPKCTTPRITWTAKK